MKKVTAIGELLIDFISEDVNADLIESSNFKKLPGGAPANVCAAISKLGGQTAFAGKVGSDSFGRFLNKTLESHNIDTQNLIFDNINKTTLAFVSIQSDGERDFIFNRGADGKLKLEELNINTIMESNVIHFGSATALLGDSLYDTYIKILKLSKENNIFTSFDPNYRIDLWKNNNDNFIQSSIECIKLSNFVKMSDEEIKLITRKESLSDAATEILNLGADCICITLGKDGTFLKTNYFEEIVSSIQIKPIDATGAGDAFTGAFLYQISQNNATPDIFSNKEQMIDIVSFANKVGAIVCTRRGAMSALPTIDDLKNYG